jgi:hypothetical protein
MRTNVKTKCPGVPRLGHFLPKNRLQTLAKVFLVREPKNVKKSAFSATDRILSPKPDFSPLPNRHHWMHRSSADNV